MSSVCVTSIVRVVPARARRGAWKVAPAFTGSIVWAHHGDPVRAELLLDLRSELLLAGRSRRASSCACTRHQRERREENDRRFARARAMPFPVEARSTAGPRLAPTGSIGHHGPRDRRQGGARHRRLEGTRARGGGRARGRGLPGRRSARATPNGWPRPRTSSPARPSRSPPTSPSPTRPRRLGRCHRGAVRAPRHRRRQRRRPASRCARWRSPTTA